MHFVGQQHMALSSLPAHKICGGEMTDPKQSRSNGNITTPQAAATYFPSSAIRLDFNVARRETCATYLGMMAGIQQKKKDFSKLS